MAFAGVAVVMTSADTATADNKSLKRLMFQE